MDVLYEGPSIVLTELSLSQPFLSRHAMLLEEERSMTGQKLLTGSVRPCSHISGYFENGDIFSFVFKKIHAHAYIAYLNRFRRPYKNTKQWKYCSSSSQSFTLARFARKI